MNKQMNDTGSGEPLVFQTQNIPTSLLYLHFYTNIINKE